MKEQVEKIVANGEISLYEQFLLLSQCFQKLSMLVLFLAHLSFAQGELL